MEDNEKQDETWDVWSSEKNTNDVDVDGRR